MFVVLPAVSRALVGDVADVVGVDTLRSTPFIVDASTPAKPSLDRTFSLRPRLIAFAPAEFVVETAHRFTPLA